MDGTRNIERTVALGLFPVLVVLIMTFLLRDSGSLPSSEFYEVVGHAGASGGFTLAASGLLLARRDRAPHIESVLVGGAALTIIGEVAQYLNPTRFVELGDILTGFGGVLIAGLALRSLAGLLDESRLLRAHLVLGVVALLSLVVFLATSGL